MFGFHVQKGTNLAASIRDLLGTNPGIRAVQFFIAGPRNARFNFSHAELEEIRDLAAEKNIALVIHGAYIDAPWKENNASALANIRRELRGARNIGDGKNTAIPGVVIHFGNGTAKFIESVLGELRELLVGDAGATSYQNARLWLEIHSAKSSATSFETPEKLAALFSKIDPTLSVGLCIDTAHLHAGGVSLRSREDARTWLAALEAAFENAGTRLPPIMFHLNDNIHPAGGGRDAHAPIGLGRVWGPAAVEDKDEDEVGGAEYILEYAAQHKNIVILERKENAHLADMKILKRHL